MTDLIKVVGTDANETLTADNEATHVLGKQGDDTINGGAGDDVLEGNRGNDTLVGGAGDDILFGGVGDDSLTGGEGADTFAMRITHGGDNIITDFEVGTDNLQFLVDRKHFILENDLTRNDNHEDRVDGKLDTKMDRLEDRFLGEDSNIEGDSGVEKADAFVDAAMDDNIDITIVDGDLVLTFFADVGNGSKGTTITLEGLANDPHIARIIGDSSNKLSRTQTELDQTQIDSIVDILAGDTAVFSGSVLDYNFQNGLDITDTVADRDGMQHVTEEKVAFADGTYTLNVGHNGQDGHPGNVNNMVAEDGVDTLLIGALGNDILNGGTGNDVLFGDNGVNFTYKGGNDTLNGGAGDDILIGGGGNDTLNGGEGVDTAVYSGSVLDYHFLDYPVYMEVNDTVANRDGNDTVGDDIEKVIFDEGTYTLLRGHNAGDSMVAQDGIDTMLIGFGGHDTLTGGTGNDVLLGDNGVGFTYQGGDDVLNGGAGDDILHGGAGNDRLYGGEGVDTAIYSGSVLDYHFSNGLTIRDMVAGRDGTDQLSGVEQATFAEGTYTILRGHNAYDNLTAADGVDTLLIGADGHDDLTGGTGNDVLFGDNSIDDNYKAGDDTLDGGAGSDIILGGGGDDLIYADEKAPAHLAIDAESDVIDGGAGIDTLTYNDTYNNADSLNVKVIDSDTFTVDTMDGNTVTSTDVVSNVEVLNGTRGDDVIDFSGLGHGMTYNDKSTGAGEDVVTGSDHDDVINVMHGNDTIYASHGEDFVNGGGGDDTLIFDSGTNITVTVEGPAYKQLYKVSVDSSDDFTIIQNVEYVQVGDGISPGSMVIDIDTIV